MDTTPSWLLQLVPQSRGDSDCADIIVPTLQTSGFSRPV